MKILFVAKVLVFILNFNACMTTNLMYEKTTNNVIPPLSLSPGRSIKNLIEYFFLFIYTCHHLNYG